MKFQEILELIDKIAESGIASVEIEQSGTKLKIEGKTTQPRVIHLGEVRNDTAQPLVSLPPAAASAPQLEQKSKAIEEDTDAGLHILTSPIVGTFYRSPSPETGPFVNVGDRVTKGKVLCIIEAMKLMNEIESDVDGVVAKIYPSNGQPVEYGEKLFAIKAQS